MLLINWIYFCCSGGFCGWVVESFQGLKIDSFMRGSYPASLWNVGGFTQTAPHAWNNAQWGTWGLPPPKTKANINSVN